MFQSTPPRGGRLRYTDEFGGVQYVSIHAPARGATRAVLLWYLKGSCFNPRPRAGGDLKLSFTCRSVIVSIHAPARGATSSPKICVYCSGFQSTPPRGGRPRTPHHLYLLCMCFNPRPRAGGDQSVLLVALIILSFNPRPRAGGDP